MIIYNLNKVIFISLFLLFFKIASFGQSISIELSDTFKANHLQEICECLPSDPSLVLSGSFAGSACDFEKIFNDEEIKKYIDYDSDISLEDQYNKLGEQLFYAVQLDLVYECDNFFNLIKDLKKLAYKDQKKIYSKTTISEINQKYNSTDSLELFVERGWFYTMADEYQLAREEFERALEVHSRYPPALAGFALIYELTEDYQKAYEIYQYLSDVSGNRNLLLFSVVMKRQAGL